MSGRPLLVFDRVDIVLSTVLRNVNARGVGPLRVMSSMEWWGSWREDCALRVIVHGRCRERARVCSSIVACAVEREEVRECMETKGGRQRSGNARGKAKSGRGGRETKRWMSNYRAIYYEVDWLLTLYVEAQRGQCSQ